MAARKTLTCVKFSDTGARGIYAAKGIVSGSGFVRSKSDSMACVEYSLNTLKKMGGRF